MMEIGSSGNRGIVKPNLTTETRRRGENREIQMMIPTLDLTSSNSPSCSFVSFVIQGLRPAQAHENRFFDLVVRGFSVSMIFALTIFVLTSSGNFGIAGNSWRIGVRA
jgi:hypothetical protein